MTNPKWSRPLYTHLPKLEPHERRKRKARLQATAAAPAIANQHEGAGSAERESATAPFWFEKGGCFHYIARDSLLDETPLPEPICPTKQRPKLESGTPTTARQICLFWYRPGAAVGCLFFWYRPGAAVGCLIFEVFFSRRENVWQLFIGAGLPLGDFSPSSGSLDECTLMSPAERSAALAWQ